MKKQQLLEEIESLHNMIRPEPSSFIGIYLLCVAEDALYFLPDDFEADFYYSHEPTSTFIVFDITEGRNNYNIKVTQNKIHIEMRELGINQRYEDHDITPVSFLILSFLLAGFYYHNV